METKTIKERNNHRKAYLRYNNLQQARETKLLPDRTARQIRLVWNKK